MIPRVLRASCRFETGDDRNELDRWNYIVYPGDEQWDALTPTQRYEYFMSNVEPHDSRSQVWIESVGSYGLIEDYERSLPWDSKKLLAVGMLAYPWEFDGLTQEEWQAEQDDWFDEEGEQQGDSITLSLYLTFHHCGSKHDEITVFTEAWDLFEPAARASWFKECVELECAVCNWGTPEYIFFKDANGVLAGWVSDEIKMNVADLEGANLLIYESLLVSQDEEVADE